MKAGDKYTCESCGETFETGWSDEEAESEYRAVWGDEATKDKGVVCDDCFEHILAAFVETTELVKKELRTDKRPESTEDR